MFKYRNSWDWKWTSDENKRDYVIKLVKESGEVKLALQIWAFDLNCRGGNFGFNSKLKLKQFYF